MHHHLIHEIIQLPWIGYLNTAIILSKTIVNTYQSTRKIIRHFQHRQNQRKSR